MNRHRALGDGPSEKRPAYKRKICKARSISVAESNQRVRACSSVVMERFAGPAGASSGAPAADGSSGADAGLNSIGNGGKNAWTGCIRQGQSLQGAEGVGPG